MRLLLLDGDRRFALAFAAALRRRDHEVEYSATALVLNSTRHWDLILLELDLPDGDGLTICRELRSRPDTGLVIVTSRCAESDRVAGLHAGADDYIVKPFSFPELLARLDAVRRRTRVNPARVVSVGALTVDLDRFEAFVDTQPLELTRKEFQVLALLAAEPGVVVPRSRLIAEVWQRGRLGPSRTLDVHIATLRAKLGFAAQVRTVRGVGYRLTPCEPDDLAADAS
jgi:DNA-binding response OmpR family regulator